MNAINTNLQLMRNYFETGATKPFDFRKEQLQKLKGAVEKYQDQLNDALHKDLGKSKEEVWFTETGMVISEINYFMKHLEGLMKPQKVATNLLNIPGKSYIMPEPLGVALIIGPWNYPFQLLFVPLIGAIAAGNCVMLKPSEFASNTEAVMQQMIAEVFDIKYVSYVTGDGATVVPEMLQNFTFDHIFFTGGTEVGKKIYGMAAERLVPVTLELGGKNPCVVTANANLKVSAKRIASVKFSNAGQMCIAPDYLLVHHSVKDKMLEELKNTIREFYTDRPVESYDLGRIINQKQFARLMGYLQHANIFYGGTHNEEMRYIAPTIIDSAGTNDAMMKEEIFGPILPVLSYQTEQEACDMIKINANPLAFYVFTDDKKEADNWLEKIPSGNAAVNTAAFFYMNKNLPFGGRGNSGIGRYHGKFSFETFSHQKAVLKRPTWPDLKIAYPSYKGKLGIMKKVT
ncbi:MAG: aldehyde dehydrogenase family protein [Sphingobacteriales bacterium 41-5]|nr:MAG: aldehyde dehydrogenase [Niabella sp. SCN 42-15]OJU27328.1 MAG: aldehyde dehydrogenase family protein [Sphingobacteriales bacterium 41-5]